MTELSPLITALTATFDWHGARIAFVSQFLVALIRVRTVNLTEIATAFCGETTSDSHYRRIQRFFKDFPLTRAQIAVAVVQWLPLGQQWLLCLDRTNWKFGTMDINILVLAVAYKGVAIPLLWVFLDKRGNSNSFERIGILKHFLVEFGHERIQCLTADREFIGTEWIKFLKRQRIRFRIRIKRNTLVSNPSGCSEISAFRFFQNLPIGETRLLPRPRLVWGMRVSVVGMRIKNDYLILITNETPETALEDYAQRWEIETLFGCLKSRGFNFEDTHLTKPERISKLLCLLTLALCWCLRIGEWLDEQKSIPIKTHGRRAKSLFRHGLDTLRNIVLNIVVKELEFYWATTFLSCT
ncbi:MAG: IS4 family transposase [bacterium]|nr:IS4 family transposase [bacterium]